MSKLNQLLKRESKLTVSKKDFSVLDISQGLIQTYYGAITNDYCTSGSNSGCTNNQCETGNMNNGGCYNPNCCEQ